MKDVTNDYLLKKIAAAIVTLCRSLFAVNADDNQGQCQDYLDLHQVGLRRNLGSKKQRLFRQETLSNSSLKIKGVSQDDNGGLIAYTMGWAFLSGAQLFYE